MSAIVLAPLQALLNQIVRGVAGRQSVLFERLGRHADSTYVIDPIDLPVVLVLKPRPQSPELRAVFRSSAEAGDCRIAGRFRTLLALVDGRHDGDALFFSRDLTVEGDIDAVVSLRNALDDLDVTLTEDIKNGAGPLRLPITAALELFRALDREEARRAG
jgi:O2-independent ubiquinone biosynthesis accessory factor UbiT